MTRDSCLQWSQDTGTWEKLLTLKVERYTHVSWTPGPGMATYLIGGYGRGSRTTTLIKEDGTHEPAFQLEYKTM